MIKALAGSLQRIVKNPLLLAPGLASIAILFGLAFAFSGFAMDLLLEAVFLEEVPAAAVQAFPFQFIATYAVQLLALLVFSLAAAVLFTALSYWYAVYVGAGLGGKASFGRACSEMLSAIGKVVGFVVFVLLLLAFFGVIVWLFAMVALAIDLLGMALLALACLAGFYLAVKLFFAVQAMALEQATVKQALQNSWNFSVGKFWHVLLFVVIMALVNQAAVYVGSYASDLVLDEAASLVVIAIFWSFSLAFSGVAMALYYAEKKLGKSI